MKVNSSNDNTAHRTVKAARDGNNESPWQAALEIHLLKPGSPIADIHDILIIGSGIKGLPPLYY